jgi:hypothetical protein
MLDPRRAEVLSTAAADFPFYAAKFLSILDKEGKERPFLLNRAQRYLHERLEQQIEETGRVRALVLKGRQQGVSTYVQGRFRWKLKHRTGVKAYVMAHEQKATDNLFAMAKRYHDSEPAWAKPSTGASNVKELLFAVTDSRYEVATAGTKEVGRSGTAQFFHASEYAFWPMAETHWAGIGQTVPDMDGTEVIVESTANGVSNDFYKRWKVAIAGRGDFIPIFIPWFWQPEYAREVPKDWARTQEEDDLVALYELNDGQLAWRRAKIENDFAGDVTKFEQEYPNNWQEAFVAEKRDTFITGRMVQWARSTKLDGSTGPMVVGVDPARYGDDRTAIVVRQGRKVRAARTYEKKSTMEVAGIIVRFIEAQKPDAVFIDVIGIGAGVYDRLEELGYAGDRSAKSVVIPVNVGEGAADGERYSNKRAEVWGEMKKWLEAKPVSLPDSDEWLADLTAPGYTYDSSGRLKIESKEAMRKRGEKSPDLGDALALTFAEPVRVREPESSFPLEPTPLYEELETY